MDDSKSALDQYCEAHTTAPPDLLYRLERETYLKTLAPQMASGPLQGQLLTMLTRMLQPQLVLEIGTFTGYATLCIARGMPPTGRIHTIEVNDEIAYISQKYFNQSPQAEQITAHLGDAQTIVPSIEGQFDMVFIDAGKKDYAAHFDLTVDRVRPGGILIADNVLWSGKVMNENPDRDTQVLLDFNKKVQADPRVENVLLPIRDGLLVMQRM